MTTLTTSASANPILSAFERMRALKAQMDACKSEGVAELKALIEQKETELADLRKQLAEFTGEPLDLGELKQRRRRGPNKAKEAPESQQTEPQPEESQPKVEPGATKVELAATKETTEPV